MGIFRKPIDKIPHSNTGMSGKYASYLKRKQMSLLFSNLFKVGIIAGLILGLIGIIVIIQIMNQLPDANQTR